MLHFDRLISNIDDGMNLKTRVFIAPKAGVYFFSFSMLKNGWDCDHVEIALRLNGTPIGMSAAGRGLYAAPVTLQSTLKLRKGDRIDLWKSEHGELQQDCFHYYHQFTGSLIEELIE